MSRELQQARTDFDSSVDSSPGSLEHRFASFAKITVGLKRSDRTQEALTYLTKLSRAVDERYAGKQTAKGSNVCGVFFLLAYNGFEPRIALGTDSAAIWVNAKQFSAASPEAPLLSLDSRMPAPVAKWLVDAGFSEPTVPIKPGPLPGGPGDPPVSVLLRLARNAQTMAAIQNAATVCDRVRKNEEGTHRINVEVTAPQQKSMYCVATDVDMYLLTNVVCASKRDEDEENRRRLKPVPPYPLKPLMPPIPPAFEHSGPGAPSFSESLATGFQKWQIFRADRSNMQPVAKAGPDLIGETGKLVVLDGSKSYDPDNYPKPLTYTWKQLTGNSVSLTGAATARAGFTVPAVNAKTKLVFQLTVSDGELTDSDTVTVVAQPGS